jgi:mannosyltransferase OCH1-like enzyme
MANQDTAPPRIPKTIYQCVARKASLPDHYAHNIERIKALNPDHRFTLFDDADILDFIQLEFGTAYVDRFLSISEGYGAVKADFFRYLLIYRHGGIYLDIKSTVDVPFDRSLRNDDQFILSQWDNADPTKPFYKWGEFRELNHIPGGEYQQWHVIAAPEHPFLSAVIALMLERIDTYTPWTTGFGHMGVMRTTGPVMYSQAIHPIRNAFPHRLVKDETEIGLRYSFLSGKHDHRDSNNHYGTSFRPVFQRRGPTAVVGSAYLAAQRGFQATIRGPLRRALRRPA